MQRLSRGVGEKRKEKERIKQIIEKRKGKNKEDKRKGMRGLLICSLRYMQQR